MNPSAEAFQKYVGLTESEAVEAIKQDGLRPRVVCRDGEHYVITMDYRTDRVNLTVTKGKVTSVHVG
jgi:hypothetical protein